MTSSKILIGLMATTASLATMPACAQDAPAPAEDAAVEIIVTGSSIRGVTDTGSAVINVDRKAIAATGATTSTEILRTVPQLNNFGASGNNNGQGQANFVDQPAIHGIGLGNGGAGLTLVLADGLRLPGAGINQTAPDPSAIPASVIDRIEVVADGASSVYGSDAVAGVLNFILRKNVNGTEARGRIGFGDGYRTYNAGLLTGKTWDTGSLLLAYEFTRNTAVNGTERAYVASLPTTLSTLCSPANVTVGGVNYAPTATSYAAGALTQCDNNKATDLYPTQHRHQVFASLNQEIGSGIEVRARAIYSRRKIIDAVALAGRNVVSAPLAVTVTSGPFYNAAVARGLPAGSHLVQSNLTSLLGDTTDNLVTTETFAGTVGATAHLGGSWKADLDLNYGREVDNTYQRGINSTLYVTSVQNGTFNPYGFGAANSPALLAQIADWEAHYLGVQTMLQARLKADGTVAELPGGEAKLAVGGELRQERFDAATYTGPRNSAYSVFSKGQRDSYSLFGELFVPLVDTGNAMAGVRKLSLSLSARHDHYSDFGATTNPKVGLTWEPVGGFTVHASWGKAFHAPSMADATTAIDTRAIRNSAAAANLTPVGITSGASDYTIILAGGNNLKPETARTWTLGFELKPEAVKGLRLSATYYNVDYRNVITFPSFNPVTQPLNPIYAPYRIYSPTAAQTIAAIGSLRHDGAIYGDTGVGTLLPLAIYDLRRQNFSRQWISGIDFEANYRTDVAGGTFGLGISGTKMLVFNEQINGSTTVTRRLDTNYAVNFRARGQVSYAKDQFDGAIFVNYTNGYNNPNDPTVPAGTVARVASNTTVDTHFGYTVGLGGKLKEAQIALDISNLFNVNPPLYRTSTGATGWDNTVASALGRVVSVGVTTKF